MGTGEQELMPAVEPEDAEAHGVVAPEQAAYARVVRIGSRIGLAALVAGQILYLAGIVPAFVAPARLEQCWGLSASAYARAVGTPTGWGWVGMLRYGDFLNLAGVAILSSVTVAGCLALLRVYASRRDRIYAAITLLELLVLALAASGVVAGIQ